jgi:V/A-type H+-transporting ATPase subunit C
MAEFDYGNTRLRGMKSRLCSDDDLMAFAALGSVDSLLNALTQTPYRTAVEAAMIRSTGLPCLNRALQDDLVRQGQTLRGYFDGAAARQVGWALRRYDLHNLKTVLRGVAQRQRASLMLETLLPIGDLQLDELTLLAGAEDMQSVIDLLVTWRSPFAQPFLVRDALPLTLFGRELQLEHWYTTTLLNAPETRGTRLRERTRLEADVANVQTALRLVGVANVVPMLERQLRGAPLETLFVGPGQIPTRTLVALLEQPDVRAAIGLLDGSVLEAPLSDGLAAFEQTGWLSAIELALLRFLLEDAQQLVVRDALGIGVLIGYLALKTAEISNLRAIGNGLAFGDAPEAIAGAWVR